jgi:hypothetical protein
MTTTNISFEKDYVKTSECKTGIGKVVTTDLQGHVKYSSDFVFSGGNIASVLAEFICAVGKPQRTGT